MERMIEAMTDEPSEQNAALAEHLRNDWIQRTPYLRPIVNRTVVRTMSDLVSDLCIYAADEGSTADYRATREKVVGAIDEMRRAERATFGLWS